MAKFLHPKRKRYRSFAHANLKSGMSSSSGMMVAVSWLGPVDDVSVEAENCSRRDIALVAASPSSRRTPPVLLPPPSLSSSSSSSSSSLRSLTSADDSRTTGCMRKEKRFDKVYRSVASISVSSTISSQMPNACAANMVCCVCPGESFLGVFSWPLKMSTERRPFCRKRRSGALKSRSVLMSTTTRRRLSQGDSLALSRHRRSRPSDSKSSMAPFLVPGLMWITPLFSSCFRAFVGKNRESLMGNTKRHLTSHRLSMSLTMSMRSPMASNTLEITTSKRRLPLVLMRTGHVSPSWNTSTAYRNCCCECAEADADNVTLPSRANIGDMDRSPAPATSSPGTMSENAGSTEGGFTASWNDEAPPPPYSKRRDESGDSSLSPGVEVSPAAVGLDADGVDPLSPSPLPYRRFLLLSSTDEVRQLPNNLRKRLFIFTIYKGRPMWPAAPHPDA